MRRLIALTLIVMALVACADADRPFGTVSGLLVAGPTCPVESSPPDPACAAAPVAGAMVTAITSSGEQYSVESDEEGRFALDLPAGNITLHFGDVDGLMGTPEDLTIQVIEGQDLDVGAVAYDTGIR